MVRGSVESRVMFGVEFGADILVEASLYCG